MNLFIHLWIAREICRKADVRTRMKLNRACFALGNIWPDLDHKMAKKAHDYSHDAELVYNLSVQASQINTAGSLLQYLNKSFRLGQICHFLADFNCHVHQPEAKSSLSQHYAYELKMMFHLQESRKIKIYRSALSWRPSESLHAFMRKSQQIYRADQIDFATDVAHAVNTSVIVVTRLIRKKLTGCLVPANSRDARTMRELVRTAS